MNVKINNLLKRIKEEEGNNQKMLYLTASESKLSETARMFLGSRLSEKYFAGAGVDKVVDFFGLFTQPGFPEIDSLVTEAEDAAKEMLGAGIVNLNPLSGIHAMMCALLATTNPGDTVMTLDPETGGHFATTGVIERFGRKNVYAAFDIEKLEFDFEKTAKIFHETHATALYLDPMYYIKPYDIRKLRKAIGKKAIIIYDASHTMGLIMGQVFQSPLREGADVICANTHKTLPGPQKGIIAFKDKKFGEKANIIIKGSVSSVHTHHVIALAITILEMKVYGKKFAQQIIKNSNAIGKAFTDLGYDVRKVHTGRFSENHQVHIYIDNKGERLDLYKKLLGNNIATNFARQPGSRHYIRLGTQEVTRRGMKEKEMKQIASYIDRVFKGENIKDEIVAFNKKFPNVLYSFDQKA